jgi:hypothetical protein
MIATRVNVADPYRARVFSRSRESAAGRITRNDRYSKARFFEVTYKIADCLAEREAACRLVHDAYVKSNLIDPNRYRMRVTPFHLLPTTDVFIALYRQQVIYTVTLISDDDLGLPLEDLYPTEIEGLRRRGLFLSEVSCLASRDGIFSQTEMFDVFVNLMSLMAQYARHNDLDRFLIAVHPRHMRLYQRMLGFEQIGPVRKYASVRYNPAVAASHDFMKLDRNPYRLYDRIYGNRFRPSELLRQPMPLMEREYFSDAADAFKTGPKILTSAA